MTPTGSGSKLVELTATPAPAEQAEPPPPPPSQQSQPMETQDQSAPPVKDITAPNPASSEQSATQHPAPAPASQQDSQQPQGRVLSAQDKRILEQRDKFPQEDAATTQAHPIIIPSYASWFSYNNVNAIEKRSKHLSLIHI